MILAKNKHGQIGRVIPSAGFDAVVATPTEADHRGNVYLSTHSIEADQAYYAKKENETRAKMQAERLQRIAQRLAEKQRQKNIAQMMGAAQIPAKYDHMNSKLKKHFAKMGSMGETAQVEASLLPSNPADFSESGANPQYVTGERMTGGDQWDADWRQHYITGSPLTRDGVFGPAVTDYDRFVHGLDVNQTNVVKIAGGTMAGRYEEQQIALSRQQMGHMGFDWSWEGISNAVTDIADQTVDNVTDSLPAHLAQELQNAVGGGSGGGVQQVGNTYYVPQPMYTGANTVSQTLGVPPMVLYIGAALVGVTLLAVVLKSRSA